MASVLPTRIGVNNNENIEAANDNGNPTVSVNQAVTTQKAKLWSLGLLVFQNCALVLLISHSRTDLENLYIPSVVILSGELIKLFVCILVEYHESSSMKELVKKIFGRGWESAKIIIPAFLYVIQNNLLFLALGKLDPATYQITAQFKILTTAFFSITILKRQLQIGQWISLLVLLAGITCVQLIHHEKSNDIEGISPFEKFKGLIYVLISSVLSGISGVYLEKILKHSETTIWTRNIQLSLLSIIPVLGTIYFMDMEKIKVEGVFVGFNTLVWVIAVLQGLSGLLVAVVLKYADNILKGFATSISIVLSSVLTMILFGFEPNFQWLVGAFLVLCASFMYNYFSVSREVTPKPIILPTVTIENSCDTETK